MSMLYQQGDTNAKLHPPDNYGR